MNNEEIKQQIADAIISGKIQTANIILGDNVQHKIEKVESGGIGIQIVNNGSVADENASVQQSDQPRSYCEYINREKLQEFNIYTLDEFEAMFAKATKGTAPELAAFLKKYRELKVLDFGKHDKKQIFENLRAHFKEMRQYEYPNFAAAY